MTLRIGSTFSGVGGLDIATQTLYPDSRVVWHSEINPDPAHVLAHHHPAVPNLGDITRIPWQLVQPVDILTGGFPCQDLSLAGTRRGLSDGTRSGLWWHLHTAIKTLRPRLVLLENVPGILTAWGEPASPEWVAADTAVRRLDRAILTVARRRAAALRKGQTDRARRKLVEHHRLVGLRKTAVGRRDRADRLIQRAVGTVLGSLAEIGFDAEWACVPASTFGAAHKRDRWFLAAWPTGTRPPTPTDPGGDGFKRGAELNGPAEKPVEGAQRADVDGRVGTELTFPTPTARDHKGGVVPIGRMKDGRPRTLGDEALPDTVARLFPTPTASAYGSNQSASPGAAVRPSVDGLVRALFPTPRASDGAGGPDPLTRPERQDDLQTRVLRLMPTPRASDGPNGGPNQRGSKGDLMLPSAAPRWKDYGVVLDRHAMFVGRPHPHPVEPNAAGDGVRINPGFSEWLMCLPDGWVTDPGVGLSRSAQLTAIGNGVVPPQAVGAYRELLGRAHQ